LRNTGIKEHEVFDDLRRQAPFIDGLPENVFSILTYGFSEMLNNAIEHSGSGHIEVEITRGSTDLTFVVKDTGIGVFRNVMKKRSLNSELEAIQDILKGKTTTRPRAHSGEGIFFTSKVADIFILDSFGYRLRIDNRIKDIFVEELPSMERGTKVTFVISKNSRTHLNDIFKKYQTDTETLGFDKTEVHIRLYTMGTIYVSRSQARRVLVGLDKFESVILDFDRVPTIGQAFADEIFRVFKQTHPDVKISSVNANEAVSFMIGRVGRE
jgi:anti-sigma regulatory factor (Ser/Thr protein kinase)